MACILGPAGHAGAAQEAGSLDVAWQATVDFSTCGGLCPASYTGSASGNITGVDGTTPYSVFWPGSTGTTQNATVTYNYTTVCNPTTRTSNGMLLTQGTITATGAQIVYNGQATPATVAVDFGASTVQDTLLVSVSAVRITWGSSLITISPPRASGGVLQMVPTVPAVGCLTSNTQGYAIFGTLVTFNPV